MKRQLGAVNCLYPMPTVLVGAMVNGRPNYITIAHVGIVTVNVISISSHKSHYTNAGIKQNGTFSINVPAESLVKETDYCGLVSGRDQDKGTLFETFYGVLKTAPMIAGCPICMEVRLLQALDFTSHELFVGEIVQTHCDEGVLTDGKVDFGKVKPMLFDMPSSRYWRLGASFARCWDAGKSLNQKQQS